MIWQCPDCTYLNDAGVRCCDICGYPAPAAVKLAAGDSRPQHPRGVQQQQGPVVVDLVSEGGPLPSMGSGGSKGAAAAVTLDADYHSPQGEWDSFEIQLSDSRSLATSSLRHRRPASSGGTPVADAQAQAQNLSGSMEAVGTRQAACVSPAQPASSEPGERDAPAAANEQDGKGDQPPAALDHQGSGASAGTAVAQPSSMPQQQQGKRKRAEVGSAAASWASRDGDAAELEICERLGSHPPERSSEPLSSPPPQQPHAVERGAPEVPQAQQAAAPQAQQAQQEVQQPAQKKARQAEEVRSQEDANAEASQPGGASRSTPPCGVPQAARQLPSTMLRGPQLPSAVPRGPQLPEQPSRLLRTRPARQPLPPNHRWSPVEQPSALLEPTPSPAALSVSPGTAREAPRPPTELRLPKQASLRLPLRRASADRRRASPQSAGSPSDAGAPSQVASPLPASPLRRSSTLPHQMPSCKPPLPPSKLLKSTSLPPGQEGQAGLPPPPRQLKTEDAAAAAAAEAAAARSEEPAVQPDAWWSGLAALYPRGQPCATDQLQHRRRSGKATVPAWVQRAKQSAVDVTPALLAAAAKCPPVAPVGHASAGRPPTQGWLAYRVAAQLPQAAACRSAAAVLELGAAAAAAASREAHGAPLLPAAAAGLAAASSTGPGPTGTAGMDLAEAASRLLAAARPSHLAACPRARLARFFAPAPAAARLDLRQRLGAELGGAHGGNTVSTASRRAARGLRRAAPSRPVKCGDGGRRGPQGVQYRGVRAAQLGFGESFRYEASTSVHSKQVWLGTYATAEAGAEAVDLAAVYRWLLSGRADNAALAFNLPHKNYLQDAQLLREMSELTDLDGLKRYVKKRCGAGRGRRTARK